MILPERAKDARVRSQRERSEMRGLGEVDAEPLNSAPGAEEGSLHQLQGSDALDFAGAQLNRS